MKKTTIRHTVYTMTVMAFQAAPLRFCLVNVLGIFQALVLAGNTLLLSGFVDELATGLRRLFGGISLPGRNTAPALTKVQRAVFYVWKCSPILSLWKCQENCRAAHMASRHPFSKFLFSAYFTLITIPMPSSSGSTRISL